MAQWLDRLRSTSSPSKGPKLPSLDLRRTGLLPAKGGRQSDSTKLPNASLIYGVAAAMLVAVSLYFLFTGLWLTGILLWFPAGCLFGFAVYFLHYTA